MFPAELEREAFRSNDEFGWTRAQIPVAVKTLIDQRRAILGGELWWVCEGAWSGLIPQRTGPPAVYPWTTERLPGEPWPEFIERAAADTIAAVKRWPSPDDLPRDLEGQILYNITWVSESEFENLRQN